MNHNLQLLSSNEKEMLKKEIKSVICPDISFISCTKCGSTQIVKYGHTKRGSQRYMCAPCSNVFSFYEYPCLKNTNISTDQWIVFAEGLIDGIHYSKIINVTHHTSWFLRERLSLIICDIMYKHDLLRCEIYQHDSNTTY